MSDQACEGCGALPAQEHDKDCPVFLANLRSSGELERALPPNMTRETVVITDGQGRRVEQRTRYLTVHECLGRIVAELPAIGKDSTAPQAIGGFKFRGIEAVKAALNPLLAKYGVFYVPDVLARTTEEKRGKEHATTLHVRYTWYGPAGDSVVGSIWSEGMDTRDKGHQKALTSAEKYWLVQSLAITTEEQSADDLDRAASPEPSHEPSGPERARMPRVKALRERLAAALLEHGGEYPDAWKHATPEERGPGRVETLDEMLNGEREPMTAVQWQGAMDLLDRIGQEEQPEPPCERCGSTRAQRVTVDGVWRCANPKDCTARAEKRASEPDTQPPASAQSVVAGAEVDGGTGATQ